MSQAEPCPMPGLIYGTAWKKERTAELVTQALRLGFRGIDTACQPKHYHEAGVGEALQILAQEGLARHEIYVQTKFTPLNGQDPLRLPYNPEASLTEQVQQSFQVSLANLKTDYLDALVLHSPYPRWGELYEVWTSMEELYHAGKVKRLGISNCYDLPVLRDLCEKAAVPPSIVQNRLYAETGFDHALRLWCKKVGIAYQSFWTLTANPEILRSPHLQNMAAAYERTPEQIFFRALIQLGLTPLTGTCQEQHMREDLAVLEWELPEAAVSQIKGMITPV